MLLDLVGWIGLGSGLLTTAYILCRPQLRANKEKRAQARMQAELEHRIVKAQWEKREFLIRKWSEAVDEHVRDNITEELARIDNYGDVTEDWCDGCDSVVPKGEMGWDEVSRWRCRACRGNPFAEEPEPAEEHGDNCQCSNCAQTYFDGACVMCPKCHERLVFTDAPWCPKCDAAEQHDVIDLGNADFEELRGDDQVIGQRLANKRRTYLADKYGINEPPRGHWEWNGMSREWVV